VIEYWKDSPALEKRLERVEAVVAETIDSPGFPLRKAVADAAATGGKLLRPALLLIGSDFGRTVDAARIKTLAAAMELLHVATLAHDDIIDEAPVRRGKPSLFASVGTKEAILAGDWLFSRCFLLAAQSAGSENARGLARLIAAICSAEINQDMAKFEYSASVRSYLRTIAGKTAALFSLALYAGASEAKAGRAVEQSLRRAGYGIGMAFQVIDDILDFESEAQIIRKPVGRDIAEGLCTLPLIYALRADQTAMRAALVPVAELSGPAGGEGRGEAKEKAAGEAAALATALGGPERAREDARGYTARALDEIDRLPQSIARSELEHLAERLLHRSY
jgi:heptaprenyl diphosphate synthase